MYKINKYNIEFKNVKRSKQKEMFHVKHFFLFYKYVLYQKTKINLIVIEINIGT